MKKYSLKVIGILLILISSCTKEDSDTLPTIISKEITGITDTSAISGGVVISNGNDLVFERGVCWSSTTLEPIISDSKTSDGEGKEEFTSEMKNLLSNTTYYVRAYATNSVGTAYGGSNLFKTNAGLPSITTSMVSLITQNSAKSGGIITAQNNLVITARGICWGTEPSPNLLGNKTIDGSGQGEFVSNITELDANSSYYVRAYATNTDGVTTYGTDSIFKTKADLPILTTNIVSLITQTTATSGGNVISNGGVSIVSRGVCWNTNTLPEITDNKTIDNDGLGEFTSNISGLLANTLYYLRAYATNSEGETAYGDEQVFTTQLESIEYPSTSDIGENILNDVVTSIEAYAKYSLATILPNGTRLTIKMSGGTWYYRVDNNLNWNVSSFDFNNNSQSFTSDQDVNSCDLQIEFEPGTITIEYFENGANSATKTKQLTVNN
jgi:hypothetical protein